MITTDELPESIYNILKDLPKENLIVLLCEALIIMQSYNNQSVATAILHAMDAKYNETNRSWRIPPLSKIIENTGG